MSPWTCFLVLSSCRLPRSNPRRPSYRCCNFADSLDAMAPKKRLERAKIVVSSVRNSAASHPTSPLGVSEASWMVAAGASMAGDDVEDLNFARQLDQELGIALEVMDAPRVVACEA